MAKTKATEHPVKRERGRPGVDPRRVLGTANHFRVVLPHLWPTLAPRLLACRTPDEITAAFQETIGQTSTTFVPHWSEVILKTIRDRKFPRVRGESQIHFLADSLGAEGVVTPRRSREICSGERQKVRHVIVRRDFYIECTCGYEGPAREGACRKCGTRELSPGL